MSKLHRKVLAITQQSWELFQRMFARSVALALLTCLGFALVDHLVDSGMTDRFALVHRFPEFIPMMLAAAKLTFIEMSVFWIRFATQPRLDVQACVEYVHPNSVAGAITHGVNSLVWAFRIVVLLYLAQ
jgi:cell shape-determining protein MreD